MKSFLGITNRAQGIVFFVLIVVVFLVTLDPFHWISPAPAAPRAAVDTVKLGKASAAFMADAHPAESTVVALFEKHPVVLAGAHNLIKEEIDFVVAILPTLYRNGVNLLGVEFLLAADQADIDQLLGAAVFDEKQAKNLMFRRLPLWGYQEYLNLLKAAWQVNVTKSPGQPNFRIVGLGINQDFSVIKNQDDFQRPEIMHRILAGGIPDVVMAEKVLQALGQIDGSGKIVKKVPANSTLARMLVLTQRMSSYSHFEDGPYRDEMKKYGYDNQRRMGALLHDVLGDQVGTVLFYSPVPFQRSPIGVTYPDGGLIDAVLGHLDPTKTPVTPVAFDLAATVFGKLDCSQTDLGLWTSTHQKPTPVLKDLADVAVVFAQIKKLHLISPIPDFINSENVDAAYKILPTSVDPKKIDAAQLNNSIEKLIVEYRKVLNAFQ